MTKNRIAEIFYSRDIQESLTDEEYVEYINAMRDLGVD